MAPTVSVILTAYNRAGPLRVTLESLLRQTFSDFELLICDDASSDGTPLVAREYALRDSRIQYRRNGHNLGMPANLNEGILAAQGRYVANLHDGDLYDCRLLEKWVAALERHPRAAFVFNQYRTMDTHGQVITTLKEDLPPAFSGKMLLEGVFFRRWRFDSPVWGTVMARRDAYLNAGLFDPRFGCIADVDMWMRLAETHDVAYVGEALITLPSGEKVPSNWKIPKDILRQIFWEARMRHYSRRTLRRWSEAARHLSFVAASLLYNTAIRLRLSLNGKAVGSG